MVSPKISLIISSFNQKKRLRRCLQSALAQKIGANVSEYQIIVADDNSTDGTIEMLNDPDDEFFGKIQLHLNSRSIHKTYTLADNWNTAVSDLANGDRLIFTNGDIVFSLGFVEAHGDPIMQDHIIIGPAMRTTSDIVPYINDPQYNYSQIIGIASMNNWLVPDMRQGNIAHSYNKEEKTWHVYGYNFSIPKKYFDGVGGFPQHKQYGDEDIILASIVAADFNCKVLTNKNAFGVHLWHNQFNVHGKFNRDEYQL